MKMSKAANAIRNALILVSLLVIASQAQGQFRVGGTSTNAMEKSVVMIRSVSQDLIM